MLVLKCNVLGIYLEFISYVYIDKKIKLLYYANDTVIQCITERVLASRVCKGVTAGKV